MRTIAIGLLTAMVLAVSAPGHSIQLGADRYSSCAALLVDYPNGVARSKASAKAASRQGFARPSVSPSLYRGNGSRLDRDRDGVMCEQAR